METLADPHPFTDYRLLRLDLLGAVFCCKLRMLITIANVPLMRAKMLQMASNLFTVSPPFVVFIIPHMCVAVNAFLQSFFELFQLFILHISKFNFHFRAKKLQSSENWIAQLVDKPIRQKKLHK